MTNSIEATTTQYIQQANDPVTFAVQFPAMMQRAMEQAQTPGEISDVRTALNMGMDYLKHRLPRLVEDRAERFRLMHANEKTYVLASAKAGTIWNALENRREPGRPDSDNRGNSPNYIGAEDAGFMNRRDATTCSRLAELDSQDLDIYFQECATAARHVTVSGAERIWHLLNGKEPAEKPHWLLQFEIDWAVVIESLESSGRTDQVTRVRRMLAAAEI